MKAIDEDELYTPGQLYKAVSETVLIEVEPAPLAAGMKLLLHPEQIKILKHLQKKLRNRLGYKPKTELVLNALVAKTDAEAVLDAVSEWFEERGEGASLYSQPESYEYREENEDEKCGGSDA